MPGLSSVPQIKGFTLSLLIAILAVSIFSIATNAVGIKLFTDNVISKDDKRVNDRRFFEFGMAMSVLLLVSGLLLVGLSVKKHGSVAGAFGMGAKVAAGTGSGADTNLLFNYW